ncbi:GNAT family N-acetyltransferase [Sphingomonas sp. CJ20]
MSEGIRESGVGLRGATTADIAFLRDLYCGFRALEVMMLPWSADQKRAFLHDQFRLQHEHFVRYFRNADFWVVTRAQDTGAQAPIGRLYLDRTGKFWRIVDIGLAPDARGAGVGGMLIRWVQEAAQKAGGSGVALQVATNNPRARQLYLRLGFLPDGDEENLHQPMLWRVPIS